MSKLSLIAMSAGLAILVGTANSPANAALTVNASIFPLTENGFNTTGTALLDSLNSLAVESVALP